MIIKPDGLYLSRTGRTVGIAAPAHMPETSRWRWLTTRGYYVLADGRAAVVGESSDDLVADITPSAPQVAGVDSTMGALP